MSVRRLEEEEEEEEEDSLHDFQLSLTIRK
jgi:hypothetical protein